MFVIAITLALLSHMTLGLLLLADVLTAGASHDATFLVNSVSRYCSLLQSCSLLCVIIPFYLIDCWGRLCPLFELQVL